MHGSPIVKVCRPARTTIRCHVLYFWGERSAKQAVLSFRQGERRIHGTQNHLIGQIRKWSWQYLKKPSLVENSGHKRKPQKIRWQRNMGKDQKLIGTWDDLISSKTNKQKKTQKKTPLQRTLPEKWGKQRKSPKSCYTGVRLTDTEILGSSYGKIIK